MISFIVSSGCSCICVQTTTRENSQSKVVKNARIVTSETVRAEVEVTERKKAEKAKAKPTSTHENIHTRTSTTIRTRMRKDVTTKELLTSIQMKRVIMMKAKRYRAL